LDIIDSLNKNNINELKKKEKILKDLENEIISKKNIISKENYDKEVLMFKEKANKFKEDQSKMVDDFNNYKKKELDGILSKISPIINAYMEKKSVKILLDSKNILIGRSNLNLTNEVIKEINEKIK
jgi:outer membrane protein